MTDAGLAHLARLSALKRLNLDATGVTDAGMPALARITSLETLSLAQVLGLTDAGLVPLRGLAHLRQLVVSGTKVTPEGVAALRAAIPPLGPVTRPPAPPRPREPDRSQTMSTPTEPTSNPSRPRRRWLRISLRGLMVLVLLVGGGLGWQVNRVRTRRAAEDAVRGAGGRIVFDYQFSTDPSRRLALRQVQDPPAPAWLRRVLGDDWFRSVASVTLTKPAPPAVYAAVAELDGLVELTVGRGLIPSASWPALGRLTRLEAVNVDDTGADAPAPGRGADDAAVAILARLPALRSLRLARAPVTDAGLRALAGAAGLRALVLGDCRNLTDAGIARLLAAGPPGLETFALYRSPGPVPLTVRALAEHHPGLKELGLAQTGVADADLTPIGALANLKNLSLPQTGITGAALAHLVGLARLESLSLGQAGVTDAGMASVGRLLGLTTLDLTGSRVGDAGLAELAGLPRLATLRVGGTAVTPTGLAQIGAARPTVKVDARTSGRPAPPSAAPSNQPPSPPEAHR